MPYCAARPELLRRAFFLIKLLAVVLVDLQEIEHVVVTEVATEIGRGDKHDRPALVGDPRRTSKMSAHALGNTETSRDQQLIELGAVLK